MTPWDDAGVCKYTYGEGDGSRKPKPEPVFVDSDGKPVEKSVLLSVRKGTKVNLIVDQKPYAMGPNVGTSMRVIGVQIIELATGNGAVDSGSLSVEDVAELFGSVDGFKASEPAVRKVEETVGDGSPTTSEWHSDIVDSSCGLHGHPRRSPAGNDRRHHQGSRERRSGVQNIHRV